jgi:hypothetical protein
MNATRLKHIRMRKIAKMTLLTIAQIDSIVLSGTLATLSLGQLSDAHHAVLSARDPAHMGEEPHLRCEVDACGLDDDRLVEIESTLWIEQDSRQRNAVEPVRTYRLAA